MATTHLHHDILMIAEGDACEVAHLPGYESDRLMGGGLQDHVKRVIAPYKYPRSVVFSDALPRTESGKIRRLRSKEGT